MCGIGTVNAVIEVVEEFVKLEKMFTAYDVTQEVRKRADEQVDYHSEIKRVVHGGFDWVKAGYQSTLITLNVPQNPQAFVYHPLGTDPMAYPLAVEDSVDDSSDDSDDDDKSVLTQPLIRRLCKVTSERRLNIPKRVLLQVQCDGGSYDISVNNGGVFCKKPTTLDSRVRLSSPSLGDAQVGDKFKVYADTNRNVVLVESV